MCATIPTTILFLVWWNTYITKKSWLVVRCWAFCILIHKIYLVEEGSIKMFKFLLFEIHECDIELYAWNMYVGVFECSIWAFMAMVHHFTTSARSNCIQKHQVKLSFYFPFFLTIFSAHSVFINGSLMFALNWAKWPEGMILLVAKFNLTFFFIEVRLVFHVCSMCVVCWNFHFANRRRYSLLFIQCDAYEFQIRKLNFLRWDKFTCVYHWSTFSRTKIFIE